MAAMSMLVRTAPLRFPAVLSAALAVLLAAPAVGASGLRDRAADARPLVAVAANFADVVTELAAAFAASTGHELRITTGSTGKLYAQIKAGAPYDILLSADEITPERLENEGAGVPGTRFAYAYGRLVLWSSDPSRVTLDGVAALRSLERGHLAIANPELAPYGRAARETLESLGLWDRLQPRIVMGQNIGQAHSLVASGAADLGLVALSALKGPRAPARSSHWEVPGHLHRPIRQDAVLLSHGASNDAARAFLAYLASPPARAVIARHGYATAPGS
ncbi:MAG: molybdate ABC transporter substrate-binding protein [Rhizobiales bacterium]|nr:molybdate ABC transporter substrate-binding protein [Hyphomicrobiales bacterium]